LDKESTVIFAVESPGTILRLVSRGVLSLSTRSLFLAFPWGVVGVVLVSDSSAKRGADKCL